MFILLKEILLKEIMFRYYLLWTHLAWIENLSIWVLLFYFIKTSIELILFKFCFPFFLSILFIKYEIFLFDYNNYDLSSTIF